MDHQANVFWEAQLHALVHAVGNAVNGGCEIAAAHFALEHVAHVAVEVGGFEGQWLGFAQEREVACNFSHFVAVEGHACGYKLSGWVHG